MLLARQAGWDATIFQDVGDIFSHPRLALPIVAGALATNLMSFVDTLMVGQLGNSALGGVGIGGRLFFLLLAIGRYFKIDPTGRVQR